MIGSAAGLSFTDFITNTGVAVLFVLAATIVCFYFIYGRKLHVEPEAMDSILQLDENKAIKDRSLLIKSVVMILLVVFGFVFHSQLHLESCTIALTAAAVMLLIGLCRRGRRSLARRGNGPPFSSSPACSSWWAASRRRA